MSGVYGWRDMGRGTWERKTGPGTFQRYNHYLGILSTYLIEHLEGGKMRVHVRQDQRMDDILDANVRQQNDFKGYHGDDMYQATRIPIVVHEQIKKKCGFKPGIGYDPVEFKKLLNDRDYYKLKTVPGRL